MKIIESYIDAVGKHLPRKNRADIQVEIRSTLEDMLEDRAESTGRPADETLAKEILKEYGAPEKVAASYLPERYLIGPRLFPIFTLVLKIVLSVLTGLAVVGFGIRFGTSALTTEAFISIFGKTLADYIGTILSAFGNIVLIFAILQWSLPASEFEDEKGEKNWDPSSLEQAPDPDQISIWTPIWTIIMTVAALLIFNFYPEVIGIGILEAGEWTFLPVLSEAFFRFLPVIDVIWVLQIILNVILLRQEGWTRLTHWFDVVLTLISIIVAFLLLTGPALVSLSPATLTNVFKDAEAAAILAKMFNLIPVIVLVVIIVADGSDLVKKVYRLVINPKSSATIAIK